MSAFSPPLSPFSHNSLADESKLHAEYNQLCAQKSKLLSELHQTEGQVKVLRKEIHRWLEFLAEILPEDESLLDDLATSNDELFEDDNQIPSEDEEESESGSSLSAHLKGRLDETRRLFFAEREATSAASALASTAPSKRRRSISPDRVRISSGSGKSTTTLSAKNKRNYKVLPTDDSGRPPLPLVLGRSNNRTTVLELGKVQVGEEGFSRGKYFYPVGFRCKRRYFSFSTPESMAKERTPKSLNKSTFICTIEREGPHPKFSIYTEEAESTGTEVADLKLIVTDTDIDRLWSNFQDLYNPSLQQRLSEDFHLPESFLGLDHDSLQKYYAEQAAKQKN